MAIIIDSKLYYTLGIPGSLIWSKTLMELIFNPCGEFRWSPEGHCSKIHSPHPQVSAHGFFSDLLRSVFFNYIYCPYVAVLEIVSGFTVCFLVQITHTKTNTNIHARGGIRTRNPLDQASRVRPCLYALSHPDWQCSDAKKREWGTGSYRTYSSLVKLQPCYLSLRWKTCVWSEL